MSQTKAQLIDPVDGSIVTADLADDAVNADKLASNSVVSASIVDGSIVNADINASAAIAGSKIADFVTNNANNRVLTASGTANSLIGEDNLTFAGSILTVTNSSGASELTLVTPNNTDGGVYFNDGSNAGALTYQHSDNSMRFRVNSTEKMRIDSSGHVGIGLTPADSFNFGKAVDIGSTSGAFYYARDTDAGSDAVGGIGYSGSGLFIGNEKSDGFIRFSTNTSATERMRIDSSGVIGINTTGTSNATDRLVVMSPSGSNAVTSLTVDANNHTGTHANALIYAKSKNTYWAGYAFQSSHGYIGALLGKRDSAGTDDQELRMEIGGDGPNNNEEKTWTFRNNGNLALSAGNVEMASGYGIDFSATGDAAGMASELLDTYEEGTWTPTWVGSSGTGTFSYTTQIGKYTRIGRQILYTWVIIASGHSGTTGGAIRVAGLPFAVDQQVSPNAGTVFPIIGWNDSFDNCLVTQLNSSEEIEFYKQVQSTGANYSSVMASSMNLGSLYAKGGGHYIS